MSKDELIDLLDRSLEECVDSAESAINTNIPVLLFLGKALDQDEAMDELMLHTKDGDIDYCHSGNGVEKILQWMAAELCEGWNKIDAAHMRVWRETDRLREGRRKAANSR